MLKYWLYGALVLVSGAVWAQQPPPPPPRTEQPRPADPAPGAAEPADDDDTRIVGGEPASVIDARWQAEIFARGDGEYTPAEVAADTIKTLANPATGMHLANRRDFDINHRCGAALIEDGWIVTAAHCSYLPKCADAREREKCLTDAQYLRDRAVRLGTLNLTGGGRVYRIDRVVIHKRYTVGGNVNDIAVMRIVPERASAGSSFTPARIRILGSKEGDLQPLAKRGVIVTGWGLTGARAKGSSMILRANGRLNTKSAYLQKVALRLYDPTDPRCSVRYPEAMTSGKVLCAGSPEGRDACQGDSGGPMTRLQGPEPVLVGIVSGGDGCGAKDSQGRYIPGLYTDASLFRDWVKRAMAYARTHPGISRIE